MKQNQPFDPANWCIKTDKTHPRWEEFYSWFTKNYYQNYNDFDLLGYSKKQNCNIWDENEIHPPLHTIDDVLNYYNPPQVGDLCEFSDDGEIWLNVATLHLIHDSLYWLRIRDSMYGRKYCRKLHQTKPKQENLADKILSEIQKIVETYKNKQPTPF